MLKGYKTYIAAGLSALGVVAAYLVGDMTGAQAIQAIIPIVLALPLRHAIG